MPDIPHLLPIVVCSMFGEDTFDALLALEPGVVAAAADIKGLEQRTHAVMFGLLVHGRVLYLLGLLT
jgi:threonine/homoserine efflux transporter RhtA